MFHHIRKFSTTVKASPISVLYPKNNNNNVVKVMDQTSFLDEESSKKPAAAGTLLDQISLRPFQLSDVDDIMLWATDDQLSRHWKTTYRSKEDALDDLKNNMIPHPWYRAICLKNKPIGDIFVGLGSKSKWRRHRAKLGYVVAPIHWGKGIATTAVKMVLDTVFKEHPHLERLEALVDVENLGSQRVLEKAGFLKEGVLRKYIIQKRRTMDMAIFSFLSSDFKPQQD